MSSSFEESPGWLGRASMLANHLRDTELQRPDRHPAPRPPNCVQRLLRSPLLSAESEANLERDRGPRFKMPVGNITNSSRRRLQALAWRGNAHILYRRARVCAVVGSSSKLLDSEDGEEIDAADLVFRMNYPPMDERLRRHIGSRTDVDVNPIQTASKAVLNGSARSVQIYTCSGVERQCLLWSPRRFWGKFAYRGHGLQDVEGKWDRAAPALDMYARMLAESMHHKRGAWNRPTTGFMTVLLALHLCDETRLYGFGMSATQPCAKYYTEVSNRSTCLTPKAYRADVVHSYDAEAAWIRMATRNYTRRSLTCQVLPNLAGMNLKAVNVSWTAFDLESDNDDGNKS